ncbi:MAG: sigma-70 family RNA polymerase sigma factor [Clostridia bacterium]|nr:sigma-70 family RNA polymerase sigma factor [Clostridia bacterium]
MDYNSYSDQKLCEMAQNKDSEAMETLISRYKHVVASIAHSYFLVDGDVEDLVQVGMIAVFKAIQTFSNKVEFKFYVSKCVKNAIFTAIKKSFSQKNLPLNNYVSIYGFSSGDNDKNFLVADDNFGPEQSYINTETVQELKDNIKKTLSKYEWKILTLYLEGFTYKDISIKLDKQPKSVDNALQRIKKKISDFYKQTEK